VDRAVAFFIVCRQSLAGRMKSFTPPTRSRTRRGMNGNVSEWLGAIEGLPAVHERLKRVFIETMPADVLLMREDKPGTLIYCDPPYLHSERATTDDYEHEMTSKDHEAFLRIASKVGCKVMISGYRSDMYDYYLEQWTRHEFELPNNAAGGASKRRMTECLWCNWRA
jgi:DNA adenine methylase